MRALQFRAFGDPVAQLALVNLPEPQQSDGWAIVRVHAASVNPSDVKDVAGLMEGAVLPLTTRRSPVRSMCTRKSTRTFRSTDCIGFSTMPRRSPTPTSPASPRSAAGSRFSIAWPTRANILSSAMGGAPPLRRRRSASAVDGRQNQCRHGRDGVGINVSRAVGPAVAGVLIPAFGIGSPFLLNALSFIPVIAAFQRWKTLERAAEAYQAADKGGSLAKNVLIPVVGG